MTAMPYIPPPGSDDAIEQGCTCPVMDNGRGYGYMGMAGVYFMQADCPLHGDFTPDPESESEKSDE